MFLRQKLLHRHNRPSSRWSFCAFFLHHVHVVVNLRVEFVSNTRVSSTKVVQKHSYVHFVAFTRVVGECVIIGDNCILFTHSKQHILHANELWQCKTITEYFYHWFSFVAFAKLFSFHSHTAKTAHVFTVQFENWIWIHGNAFDMIGICSEKWPAKWFICVFCAFCGLKFVCTKYLRPHPARAYANAFIQYNTARRTLFEAYSNVCECVRTNLLKRNKL